MESKIAAGNVQMRHRVAVKQKRAVANALGQCHQGDAQGDPGHHQGFPAGSSI